MRKLGRATEGCQDLELCLLPPSKSYTKPNLPLTTSGGPKGFQIAGKRRVRATSAPHEVTSLLGDDA